MKQAISFYIRFLTTREKRRYLFLLVARSAIGLIDLAGVLSVGYLATSIANFVTHGANEGTSFQFLGLTLPALTAKTFPILAGIVMLLFFSKAFAAIYFTKIMAIQVAVIEARAAKLISENVLGSSLERMREIKREDLSYSVQIGTTAAFTGILNAFASLVSEGFLFVILSIAFFVFNPVATIAMLLYFAILAFLVNLFIGKRLNYAASQAYEKIVSSNRVLSDLSNIFREATVAGVRKKFFDRIYQDRRDASRNIGVQTYLAGMPRHIIETGLIGGIGLFVLAQSFTNDLSSAAATIGVFLAGGFRIVAAMLPWQNAIVIIRMNIPQSKTTWKFLELGTAANFEPVEVISSEFLPVSITVKNVSYKYPDGSVALEELNFSVPAGANVAFIGPSGSGKSTLADLVLGLASPTSGSVLINDYPADVTIRHSPGIASYVPQDPGILDGTILENITMLQSPSEIDMTLVQRVLKDANLNDFVDNLPEGLETKISPQSSEFSGGQRQRIGIARALYARPGLLILDEATAALDSTLESEITRTIGKLRGKVTVVSIAHRLNSVKNADQVFYLEAGRIEGQGTLIELRRSNSKVAAAIQNLSLEDLDSDESKNLI